MKLWAIKQTIKSAKKSKYPVFRHGALFELGGSVFVQSRNIKKSTTPSASMSVHAEIAGLKALLSKARLKENIKFNMYVARVNPRDQVVLSKPCDKCMKAIKESGIVNTVYYSTNNGTWEECCV